MPQGADISYPPARRGPTKQPPRPSQETKRGRPSGSGCPPLSLPASREGEGVVHPGTTFHRFNQGGDQTWPQRASVLSLFIRPKSLQHGTSSHCNSLEPGCFPSRPSEADYLQHGPKSHCNSSHFLHVLSGTCRQHPSTPPAPGLRAGPSVGGAVAFFRQTSIGVFSGPPHSSERNLMGQQAPSAYCPRTRLQVS